MPNPTNSKYAPLQNPTTSWLDYQSDVDHDVALRFSERAVVGIVSPSQSDLDSHRSHATDCRSDSSGNENHQSPCTASVVKPDGRQLASQLADNPSRFMTNKPDIGWHPSVYKALTDYDCLSRSGATATNLEQEIVDLQNGKSGATDVEFMRLSQSQASDFLKKRIVVDMKDQKSIYSPAMRAMRVSQHHSIGLCDHPTHGLRVVCSQDTKNLLNRDNFWNDRISAETSIVGMEYYPTDSIQSHIDQSISASKRHPGHCSFVQITPDEHNELLSTPSFASRFEVLTADDVTRRSPPPGLGN